MRWADAGIVQGGWLRKSMVLAGLISMDANAIDASVEGEKSLKSVSKYWA